MEEKINIILERLKSIANPDNLIGMAKFGITPKNAFGISVPNLRKIAKEIGKDHNLALKLYKIDYRETRILASMIDIPELVTEEQMEDWVKTFDYWEICDQVCMNLFSRTEYAMKKAIEWSEREEEFVKRAGFTLIACLSWRDKKIKDNDFDLFFDIIKRESKDERNNVKKAVNWALRQIGKRNTGLNKKAIEISKEIMQLNSKSAKWIAKDALRELEDKKTKERIKKNEQKNKN